VLGKFPFRFGAKRVRVFFAKGQNDHAQGQFLFCLSWAKKQIENGNEDFIKVFRFRMGESIGRLIAEVDQYGVYSVEGFVTERIPLMLAKSRG
jgi:hypothetical protein